jgi:eukaryotic-like serine/threonine-protein kinase
MQGQKIGRYEILSAQGRSWLAYDPESARKVDIRMMDDPGVFTPGLHHRNILELRDEGVHQGSSYRVYAHIDGETLEESLKQKKILPFERAAEITCGVLDALACLHEKNIAHCNVGTSSVILDKEGIAVLMDAEVDEQAGDESADLYSVGRMLYEMLTGKPPEKEKIAPPSSHNADLDERLDAVVLKSLSANPDDRYSSAGAMKKALQDYLVGDAEPQGALESLLYRMQKKREFPALSNVISEINKIVSDDTEGSNKLARTILQDFALTSKLLKLVNTASYGQFGGTINTISKAVVILGFDTVRNIAVSLILMEFLQNKSQAVQLKDEMAQAIMTGIMAVQLSSGKNIRDAEEVMVCSMFHNLGKMLATYYFFDESQEIAKLVEQGEREDRASARVLGIPYHELGLAIGRNWNFPPKLMAGMRRLDEGKVAAPQSEAEHIMATVNLAHELCQFASSDGVQKKTLGDLAKRYERAVKVTERDLSAAVEAGVAGIGARSELLGLNVTRSPLLSRVREWSGKQAEKHPEKSSDSIALPDQTALDRTVSADPVRPADAEIILSSGIQDVTASLVNDFNLNDVLQMVMETMYRGIGFSRILFLIRDNKQNAMVAKFGFGEGVETLVPRFRFPLPFAPDVFHLSLEKGLDIAIENVDAPNIADKIPAWHRSNVNAPCFILLPIMIKDKAVGLFYADMQMANSLNVSQQQLALLRTLRNQAVLAIKQKI